MDATETDTTPVRHRPAIMQSTRIPTTTGRPAYLVHPPGAPIPDTAPQCPAGCWCKGAR